MNSPRQKVRVHDFIEFYHFYNSFVQYIIKELDDGVPKVYFAILLVLEKYGPLPISHIGDRLSITKSNMTPLIDAMEEKGFITRKASPNDRRIITVVETEKGAKYIEEALLKLDDKLISTDTTITQADAAKALEAASFLLDLGKRILKEKY
jgi:MarR family 2-MHQ and catechol resistance regulon transcriptional repressor